MDSQLEEKIAFFKHIEACRCEDSEDALDPGEEIYRQRSRAFHSVASPAPKITTHAAPNEIRLLPETAPRRTLSDQIPRGSSPESEVEIIAVIPRNGNSRVDSPGLAAGASANEVTVPDTATTAGRPIRHTIHPLTRTRHFSPQSDPSPSVRMGKRKKDAPLKLVPEERQIFKGLSFYYIPNDDINPARKLRIKKAREHGAAWSRQLVDATHIIVDKKLTYADIERHLQDEPNLSDKILVNENYPIDCLRHHIIASPEQGQYGITGMPTISSSSANKASSSDQSDASLQLKQRRKKTTKRIHTPVPSTSSGSRESCQRSADSILSSQQQKSAAETTILSPKARKEIPSRDNTAQASAEDDELTQCIDELKTINDTDAVEIISADHDDEIGGPSIVDEAGGLSGSSSLLGGERPRKRRISKSNISFRREYSTRQDKFICMKGGTKDDLNDNPNAETIKVLQEMANEHSINGDNFRVRAYRMAIATLRDQPKKICTAEEARALPNIGKIAEKIEEIVNTKQLRELEYARNEPSREALGLFLKIYGVGPAQAKKWVSQGFRTLDDLAGKAELSANQRVGLERFDDLNTRIPRREVEALGGCVKRAAKVIDRDVELIIGGSYRRGGDSSGDIDLIVTKAGTSSASELVPFLNRLVETLTREGFLTVALASHQDRADEVDGGSKWHGCCVLPRTAFPGPEEDYRPIWRRIDLLLVPESELGAALIYFTGNDLFNRSIRLLASKKGMCLNQRGLYRDVLRGQGRVKLSQGTLLEGRDEKKIFEILGVRWREPHERWCG
ncbi:hypothetical protein AAE478_000814 [Parahypoxylon ruwenzoriense]